MENTQIKTWIYDRVVADYKEKIRNKDWVGPSKPLQTLFPNQCKQPIYGLEMYSVLKKSKIVFNMHTDLAYGNVANMRMFEATGVGSCLLTDNGNNLSDLFEEDQEIVTYSSFDECVEKVQYLLEHEKEREAIAMKGQKRTLKDHTTQNRCEQINEVFQSML